MRDHIRTAATWAGIMILATAEFGWVGLGVALIVFGISLEL